jgi:hypothetical protein
MNPIFSTLIGIGIGIVLAGSYYKPVELKTEIASKDATLNQCQANLNQLNERITGMLMNK